MAADTSSLLERYQVEGQAAQPAVTHEQIVAFKPEWEKYGVSPNTSALLRLLDPKEEPLKVRAIMHGDINILQACMEATAVKEEKAVRYILTILRDLLRCDSSCFGLFDQALKQKIAVAKPLTALLDSKDGYIVDTAAWLLTAIMGYVPQFYGMADVDAVLSKLLPPSTSALSDIGRMDSLANLLKSDKFRTHVWQKPGVSEIVMSIAANAKAAQSQLLYKSVFTLWLVSFDGVLVKSLKPLKVVAKLKDIVVTSRVEKVVRITMTLLKNLLKHKDLCEEVVELNLLDAVQMLEFEKWRDSELYDEIRDLAQLISNEVNEMSNFERYERELQSGSLTWSFVHTSKFWGENVMKFEQNDFRALKMLATLLSNPKTDPTTLAVACHDIGEFCTLHPLGKKKVGQLAIKERVMELMGTSGEDQRELRREALLCCQKIMLNKWQEIDGSK